jgi:valyl-tRNA synthetase
MPFLTEEIWQRLPRARSAPDSIMVARYPRIHRRDLDPDAESEMAFLKAVVTVVRNIRSEMQIPPARVLTVILRPAGAAQSATLSGQTAVLAMLARAEVQVVPDGVRPTAQAALAVVDGCEVYVPLAGVIDVAAERQRLGRERDRAAEELARLEAKLARVEFRERAPAEVVAREEARRSEQVALMAKLEAGIERLDAVTGGHA